MKVRITRWQRWPIQATLIVRETRPALLFFASYPLAVAALLSTRNPPQEVGLFLLAILVYGVILAAPAFSAGNWRTVLLSAERIEKARDDLLMGAVESHATVLGLYLASELGEFRNQIIAARSNRLPADLDGPHREKATELVLHTLRLFLADAKIRTTGTDRKRALKSYVDRVHESFADAATAPGAVVELVTRFYDQVDPRFSAESKIWVEHGSMWETLERHSNLIRIFEILVLVTLVVIGSVLFKTPPIIGP